MTDPKIPEMIFSYASSSTKYSPPSQPLHSITTHGKSALRVTMHASKTQSLANSVKKRSFTNGFFHTDIPKTVYFGNTNLNICKTSPKSFSRLTSILSFSPAASGNAIESEFLKIVFVCRDEYKRTIKDVHVIKVQRVCDFNALR